MKIWINLKLTKTLNGKKHLENIWKNICEIRKNKIINFSSDVIENNLSKNNYEAIYSFNRSIVFNNSLVGPDIGWLVPPGFKWNNKYKFDTSEGHNGKFERKRRKKFLGLE